MRSHPICFIISLAVALLVSTAALAHPADQAWKTELAYRNHPQAVLSQLEAALSEPVSDSSVWADLLLHRATARWYLAMFDSAYEDFFTCLDYAQHQQDSILQAMSWQGLATVVWQQARYDQGLDYQLRAWSFLTESSSKSVRADALLWLGILHADLRQYRFALSYYHQGIDLAGESGDSLALGKLWNWVARAHRKQEQYDSARWAHQISLGYFKAIGDSLGISDYLNNMGSIFRREGQFDSAIVYFQQSLSIKEKLQELEGLADGYNDLGTTYSQLGQPTLAFTYLEKALQVAQSKGLRDDVRYAYASLAATYDSIGDYASALRYFRMESDLRDSLLQKEIARRTDLLTMLSESERQKAEIMRLNLQKVAREAQSKRQRQVALFIMTAVVVLFGVGYWRILLQRAQAKELEYKNRQIQREKSRSEELLLNILPASIAEEILTHGKVKPRELENVTVMFIDFVGFTTYSAGRNPRDVVRDLQTCFEAFDRIVTSFGLEKIKTIGDAYMCAGGLPEPLVDHEILTVRAALRIQEFMEGWIKRQQEHQEPFYQARIGIHSGPVVAGVVGLRKFTYDIWGNTVNVAARMESSGQPGRVNISEYTYRSVAPYFICRPRGKVKAKNIGDVEMYFVDWAI